MGRKQEEMISLPCRYKDEYSACKDLTAYTLLTSIRTTPKYLLLYKIEHIPE